MDNGLPWGVAFVGGAFGTAVAITLLLVRFFPHWVVSQWILRTARRMFGEPDTDPYKLLAPARDAGPRILLTVADTGNTRQWVRVVADIDHLVRIPDTGHGYEPVVEHAFRSMVAEQVRSASWLMRIPPSLLEPLLRQLALLAEDLGTITITVWEARPFRVLRTEPVTGEIPILPEWRQG